MEQGAKLTFLSTGQKASQSLNLTSHTIYNHWGFFWLVSDPNPPATRIFFGHLAGEWC